jgi:hypothetical protein
LELSRIAAIGTSSITVSTKITQGGNALSRPGRKLSPKTIKIVSTMGHRGSRSKDSDVCVIAVRLNFASRSTHAWSSNAAEK